MKFDAYNPVSNVVMGWENMNQRPATVSADWSAIEHGNRLINLQKRKLNNNDILPM